jgi:hypothetical protein
MTAAKKPVRPSLSRELILSDALDIVDSDQVREPTMSRLGDAIGADPRAVYRHLPVGEQMVATRADSDSMFDTMIETFLRGLAAERGPARRSRKS